MNRLGGSFLGNAALRLIITGGLPKNAVLQHCQYCLERQSCPPNATCGKLKVSTKQNVLLQAVGCFYWREWDNFV